MHKKCIKCTNSCCYMSDHKKFIKSFSFHSSIERLKLTNISKLDIVWYSQKNAITIFQRYFENHTITTYRQTISWGLLLMGQVLHTHLKFTKVQNFKFTQETSLNYLILLWRQWSKCSKGQGRLLILSWWAKVSETCYLKIYLKPALKVISLKSRPASNSAS